MPNRRTAIHVAVAALGCAAFYAVAQAAASENLIESDNSLSALERSLLEQCRQVAIDRDFEQARYLAMIAVYRPQDLSHERGRMTSRWCSVEGLVDIRHPSAK
jgi:hypothetical protein